MKYSAKTLLRWLLVSLILAAGVAGAWAVYRLLASPTLVVTEVVEGPVVQAFYATGTLLPDREYPVKSNVEGIVAETWVDKGAAVQQGEKLALVRVEQYLMQLSQAEADLELRQALGDEDSSPVLLEYDARIRAAEEQLEFARREYRRVAKLRETNAVSVAEHDLASERFQTRLSEVESLRAERERRKLEMRRDLRVAQAALEIAQSNLADQTLRSPIDGVVLDRPTPAGTRVRTNDPLLHIADLSPQTLVMRAHVDEEDKTRLEIGQQVIVSLYAYPDRTFEGRVSKVYPKADTDRRTFEVDVAMQSPDPAFAAGMTGELAFVVQSKERATIVPSQAVQAGAVWLVRDGRLLKVDAEVGLRNIERTEILSGVRPGDRVVISPVRDVQPGQRVHTRYLDPLIAAGLNKPAVQEQPFRGW